MSATEMNSINAFISAAAAEGLDAALRSHGQGLPVAEVEGLKTLSAEDFRQLDIINKKITNASGFAGTEDWACGAVC